MTVWHGSWVTTNCSSPQKDLADRDRSDRRADHLQVYLDGLLGSACAPAHAEPHPPLYTRLGSVR